MDIENIIYEFYKPGSVTCELLLRHGERVAAKSIGIAENLTKNLILINPDMEFIMEAAMLHDIGIFMTNAPSLGCFGNVPYICHGLLGRTLLDNLGFPKHGLVSERHTGAGITAENIRINALPLPCRDMIPVSIEEKIICFADKFYSKNPEKSGYEKNIPEIIKELELIDKTHADRFAVWAEELLAVDKFSLKL